MTEPFNYSGEAWGILSAFLIRVAELPSVRSG